MTPSMRLLLSWAANALALAVAAAVLSRMTVAHFGDLVLAAAVFGVLNTILKPIARLLTLPLAILTLGVAWFFVSMLMLYLTQGLVAGVAIHGFWTLAAATVIVWAVNVAIDSASGTWRVERGAGRRRRLGW